MLDYTNVRLLENSKARKLKSNKKNKKNMIECPNCKADIDNDSIYCDQCGQALAFCTKCGRVGIGKCCSYCGAPMAYPKQPLADNGVSSVSQSVSLTATNTYATNATNRGYRMPSLSLVNVVLGINIVGIDEAIIGRREGPYVTLFHSSKYVSGRHAQLQFDKERGWTIVDRKSSNGTFINGKKLPPDEPVVLSNGDTVTLANVNLKVKIG